LASFTLFPYTTLFRSKVVKQLLDTVKEKALGSEVMTALSPGEQMVKVVRDELVAILGQDTAKMKFASQPPSVVLMAGLQGSGKTDRKSTRLNSSHGSN